MSFAALLLVAGLFGLYTVSAAVIFGVALQRLIPRLAVAHMEDKTWYKFAKIVNNTALILGAGAFAILFNDAFELLLEDNKGAIVLVAVALALRWTTKCYRAVRSKKQQPAVLSSLEAAMSFVVPASIASMGVYLVLGHVFWLTVSGWTLMILAGLLLMAGGCTFLYWKAGVKAARAVQSASRMSIALYSLVAALAVQLVVRNDSPHLLTWPFAIFIILVACTLLWQGALMSTRRADHSIWWYVALLLLATPLLFTLANKPWVIYGQFTVDDGFGGLYGSTILVAILALTAAALLSIAPWWLASFKKR